MRKFLVIGCGGSGGATLRFLMDQLRADLTPYGFNELPAGWQFLHIDVPVAADRGPESLGSVPEQGGTYCALSRQGADYQGVAAKVDGIHREHRDLNALHSWRPEPAQVTFPITEGAGQYRAVGRVLTLNREKDTIQPVLKAAWTKLHGAGVHTQMQEMAAAVPGLGEVDPGDSPLVLIVSSMAGGSGASMILDIPRMLRDVPGVNPALVALFLFSPEVFWALPAAARTGVEANGAAALAELLATQTQATERSTFGRVFPFGAMIGDTGMQLGDGRLETIYRALGRGLAGLMASGVATETFAEHELTNTGAVGDVEHLGWGESPANFYWGSFGYASLSMGRDRYAEYSAQRLARIAADKATVGHMQPGENRTSIEVVRSLVTSNYSTTLERLGLATSADGQQVGQLVGGAVPWFYTRVIPGQASKIVAGNIADSTLDQVVRPEQAGNNPQQWLDSVSTVIASQRPELLDKIAQAATVWAINWNRAFAASIEEETRTAIAGIGLPYAIELLRSLSVEVERMSSQLRDQTQQADPDLATLPARVLDKFRTWRVNRGVLVNQDEVSRAVKSGYRERVGESYRNQCARLAASMLADAAVNLFPPLIEACQRALQDLESAARGEFGRVDGIAQFRTDSYIDWPQDSDTHVPERFANAQNEVLLSLTTEYPVLFHGHLASEHPAKTPEARKSTCAQEIIIGRWATAAGHPAPNNLLGMTAAWHPAVITTDPRTREQLYASRASYQVFTRPKDLLDRSRRFVGRADSGFSAYAAESLYEFASGKGLVGEQAQMARERFFVAKFREALSLARPVVGVNSEIVNHLGVNSGSAREHKFGQIPLLGTPVVEPLRAILADPSEGFAPSAAVAFNASLASSSPATRIDVFGSHPSYPPLAFTSFLRPIADRWAQWPANARSEFWKWRRARPLPEALPVGRHQRRALVAGWLIGRVCGMVRHSHSQGGYHEPAAIFDPVGQEWLEFPAPPIIPRRQVVSDMDTLAVILESMVLAIAACHDDAQLRPLLPYTTLRRLWDDSPEKPLEGFVDVSPSGAYHLSRWLHSGKSVAVPSIVVAQGPTLADRQQSLIAWLEGLRDYVMEWSRYSAGHLDQTRPLHIDLAEDYKWAANRLIEIAENPPEPRIEAVPRPPTYSKAANLPPKSEIQY